MTSREKTSKTDPLMVRSVEKAFRVLSAFNAERSTMSLSQIAAETDLDMSAAQRFTHTLVKLGYLNKNPTTRQFELSVRTLDLGYHFTRANRLMERALPYLQHLSKETEETVNLTIPDGTEVVFVSRFLSRHVLNTDVIVGTRLPAYCTAPGIAILSRLPAMEAEAIIEASDLRPFTPHTVWDKTQIKARITEAAQSGFAVACEEIYHGDGSIAAAILDTVGRPIASINIATSLARYTRSELVERFAPLVVAAARSISKL
ncbi:MAG: IclR family transcriptional regulator C-terminal domain-containing protein [Nitratireductor sp.]